MDHNPRAFPLYMEDEIDGSYNKGMTLRDWFAGMALAGIVTLPGLTDEDCAKMAYDQADIMLDERQKHGG